MAGIEAGDGAVNTLDVTGQRFGGLLAISPTADRYRGEVLWLCKCNCGNYCRVSASRMKAGLRTTCGCSADVDRARRINVVHKEFNTKGPRKKHYAAGAAMKAKAFLNRLGL